MNRRTFLAALPTCALSAETPLAQRLANDPHRPKYHFLPPAHWMNDPNGPIYWKGQYHMFYQHNPNGVFWGTMHWGHAVSPDMIHWSHLPVALAPDPAGPDKDGVFSGCTVSNDGEATIVYTGTKPEVQCIATSSDDLYSWKKSDSNPVIARPPDDVQVTGFRDPWVWRDADTWYMALGSGIANVGGAILLYRSADLREWTYLHPIYVGQRDVKSTSNNPVSSGEMWECPSFFPLDGKHVLLVSTQETTPYYVGSFTELKFTPEFEGRLDTGAYYAATSQLDAQGRRIVWGWIQETRGREAQKAAGWSGVLSLPRLLSLKENQLSIQPVAELRKLRGKRLNVVNFFLPDNRPMRIPGVAGDGLEIIAELDLGDADEAGLHVLVAEDGSESTAISYQRGRNRLSVGTPSSEERGNLTLAAAEPLRLHIFVDCSVIEVFANGRACVTGRAYPTRVDSLGLRAYAKGGSAKLRSMQVYEVKPISADRLTT